MQLAELATALATLGRIPPKEPWNGQAWQVRCQGAPKARRNYVEIVGLQKLQIQSASLVAISRSEQTRSTSYPPRLPVLTTHTVVVYYCRTYEKAVSGGGEREKGGHVLRDTTSRGLYVRVWPPHTSERRGGGGGCEQEGWQGGEGRARMSGQEERQRHSRRC
jgi:hypothetical protein